MGVLVKICGITTAEAADAAVRAGADMAGLVFHPKSPRNLALDAARSLAERMRRRIRLVALVCDLDDQEIASIVAAVRPDFLQLHGKETPERAGAIRARFGAPLIKAMAIAEPSDFAGVAAYEEACDMLLFDAKAPEQAVRPGGHGAAFDWQLLRGRKFTRPWLLAGGLHTENVARAIQVSEALGLDVSSGVESAPGKKSPALIRSFVEAAHAAHYATETRR